MKNTKFGANSMADEHGYDLDLLTGWIENLVDQESENIEKLPKKYAKRLEKVEDALQLLTEALEIQ